MSENHDADTMPSAEDGGIWSSPTAASVEELRHQVRQLQHQLLGDKDTIAGLRAQVGTLQQRLDLQSALDISVALDRVDELEDEREALIDLVHRTNYDARKAVESMQASTTWKLGTLVTRPLSKAKSLRRR